MITYKSEISESTVHTFTAFASDLYDDVPELKVGFPRVIETSIGNRQPFIGVSKKVANGDLLYVRYKQQLGCVDLIIYND